MTKEQELAKHMIEIVFTDQRCSIERTISYLNRNAKSLQYNYPREYLAWKTLTTIERNQVISDILLPF